MTAAEAFATFVTHALIPGKAARFAALVEKKKGQPKILEALCHEFEMAIRPATIRTASTSRPMDRPCFVFAGSEGFGVEFATVREALDRLSLEDGWLVLLQDGSAGIYRPEARWDDEKLIQPTVPGEPRG